MASLDFVYDLRDELDKKKFDEYVIIAVQPDKKNQKGNAKVIHKITCPEAIGLFANMANDAKEDIVNCWNGCTENKKHWLNYYSKMFRKQNMDFFVFALKLNNTRDKLMLLFNAEEPRRAIILINAIFETIKEIEKQFSAPS